MSKPLLRCNSVRMLLIFTLVFVFCSPLLRPLQSVSAQSNDGSSQYYTREFAWDYGGSHWTWNLSVPVALYTAYKAVPDSTRTKNGPAGYDMMVTTRDSYIDNLAEKLNETAAKQGYTSMETANFLLAFVQSITYASDFNTTGYEEYPRFPIETLVDQTGDCDCKAVLFATLVLTLNYDAVFINPPDHLAVGVLGDGSIQGSYWIYNNKTYYYSETTGVGFTVGQLPDEFKGQSAYVYPINQNNQYVVSLDSSSYGQPNPTIAPQASNAPTPTPASQQNPTASPAIVQPSIEPVTPISLNLISRDPVFFTVIVVAILVSMTITIKTTKIVSKGHIGKAEAPEQNVSPATEEKIDSALVTSNVTVGGSKFCIFCGADNKAFAVYCERCGKKIG